LFNVEVQTRVRADFFEEMPKTLLPWLTGFRKRSYFTGPRKISAGYQKRPKLRRMEMFIDEIRSIASPCRFR
jgi:hypothetical protein